MNGCRYLLAASLVFSFGNANAASVQDMKNAKRLYERMTGVKAPSTKPELLAVANLLSEGKKSEAANYITKTPDFLNVQIKNLALKLSNKDESVKVPFSDFAALIAGVVRDNRDFREVLTADYYYDVTGVTNADDQRMRFFNQNNFTPVETSYLNLQSALVFRPRQKLVVNAIHSESVQSEVTSPLVNLADHPEPAGVLTTRTFAERNLSGGTNRRAVEFSLKQFLCVSMAEAADANASDQYVGRDVERFPGGDHNKYLTSCKSCHSVMDGMRGAFAKLDYSNFTHGGATGFYSQMHGGFFLNQGIQATYSTYNTDYVQKVITDILPDLETRQTNSTWYQTRLRYLISRGRTDAQARTTLNAILDGIRDPGIVTSLIANYRSKYAARLTTIRANRNGDDYKATYGATCLAHLGNSNLTNQVQEEKFLQCNLDAKKDSSEVYSLYRENLTAAKTPETEKERLLGKLINKGRLAAVNLATPYLLATGEAKLFARNGFDSTTGVAAKMNKGSYPYGFVVNSDNFVNNATLGSKAAFFGWRGSNMAGGSGPKDFGKMISDSRRFSQCMAKRVYEGVCLKKLEATQYATMVRLGDRFEALNYNLKSLYQEVALDSTCGLVKE